MYKCLYLHKKSIREITIYENLLHTSGLLPDVSFKYKSVTISLPNELIAGDFSQTIKEMKKHFNYKYLQFNFYLKKDNLFLDVIYIDRSDKLAYKYAKNDMFFYKRSGKMMKDKTKFKADNDNHLCIKKGEIIPTFYKNDNGDIEYSFKKVEIFSAPFDSKLKFVEVKKKLRDLKFKVANAINKLLLSYNSNVVYLRSDEYIKKGFKTLVRYLHPNLLKKNKTLKNNKEVDEHNKGIFNHNKEILKQLLVDFPDTKKRTINI
jgi:hypothetical protein